MPSDPSSATKASLEASARYIEEKKVYELFEGLMADLLIKKPNDPIAHMIASLKQPPRPRVFVFGPPGADTQSQCELISSKLGLVHVVPKAVWREAAKGGSEAGASAKALEDEGKEVPLELKVSMLVEKLESAESCHTMIKNSSDLDELTFVISREHDPNRDRTSHRGTPSWTRRRRTPHP